MATLRETLRELAERLSDENYDESFAQYRFWLDIGSTHGHITSQDQVEDDIERIARPDSLKELIHPTAHLLVRFIGDIEADQTVSKHALGLHKRRCTSALHSFFESNLYRMKSNPGKPTYFLTNVNLIAHWANLGCVEEAVIRNHILQSLISHPRLYDHQADALFILFKLAGATFGAYADPSVVDRCFSLLRGHCSRDPVKRKLLRVRAPRVTRGGHQAEMNFQEIVDLRERNWEGLPLPPASTTRKPKPAGVGQKDPAATPVITPLGLPSRDLEPRVPQQLPPKRAITLETDTSPGSPVPHSPSVSISAMSDFTIADTSDDEFPLDTAITPHGTFYLEDGNVEVLCGNTLFRVHASVLSFHSPVLSRTLKSANLTAAESPNDCPRMLFSDAATDFATLLKIVYLPEYATLPLPQLFVPLTFTLNRFPERDGVPNFTTFSSLLRITAKYEMPAVRSRIIDAVRNAYPTTFDGLDPSKQLGERVFSWPTPHPNEVLNLFVQEKLTSALPMAYYMAVRRGLDSLMDRRLPASARLPPDILQVAIKGLLMLREMELKEMDRLILGLKDSGPCTRCDCPSLKVTGPSVSKALHQKVVDRIEDPTHSGTKLLEVLLLRDICGDDCFGFCEICVEGWEAGHADVRRSAWGMLPGMFGLKG